MQLLRAPLDLSLAWLSLCNAATAATLSLLGRPCSSDAKVRSNRRLTFGPLTTCTRPPLRPTCASRPPQVAEVQALAQKYALREAKARAQAQVRCLAAHEMQVVGSPSAGEQPATAVAPPVAGAAGEAGRDQRWPQAPAAQVQGGELAALPDPAASLMLRHPAPASWLNSAAVCRPSAGWPSWSATCSRPGARATARSPGGLRPPGPASSEVGRRPAGGTLSCRGLMHALDDAPAASPGVATNPAGLPACLQTPLSRAAGACTALPWRRRSWCTGTAASRRTRCSRS
jgi:hypothetical protein